jgi:hypothetical protein
VPWLLLIVAFVLLVAIMKSFRQQTGVDFQGAPSGIRRRARKAGNDEWQARSDSIARKQKRKRKPPSGPFG